ncbi:MAG: hypothetical protein P8Y80_05920 [Acidobacteriota bacterium]|jgi:hypothetical protein
MQTNRKRILELALESLDLKKKQIEEEIAAINVELKGKSVSRKPVPKVKKKAAPVKTAAKHSRYTKEEKLRRSKRMKEYWENWRKKQANA